MNYKTALMAMILAYFYLLSLESQGSPARKSLVIENGTHAIHTELYSVDANNSSSELVLYMPGQGDAISMYEYLAEIFIKKYQRDVFLYDVRGHGKSAGPRCHIDDYSEHLSDLNLVLRHVGKKYEKVHIVAHSTGALIASLYLLEGLDTHSIQSLTAVSPFFGLAGPELYKKFAGLASAFGARSLGLGQTQVLPFNPAIYVSTIENNLLTHDPEFFERFNGHPEKCGTPTFAWVKASMAAHERIKQHSRLVNVPMLMLTAGNDGVVSTEDARKQCEAWNAVSQWTCTYHEYEGMRHGLVYEIKEVREDIFHKIGKISLKIPSFLKEDLELVKP